MKKINNFKDKIWLQAILIWKNQGSLLYFGNFFLEKEAWSKFKESDSKSNTVYAEGTTSGVYNMQRVGSHHFPMFSLSVIKVVLFQFQPIVSSLAAFLATMPIRLKKISSISQFKF